MQRRRAPDEAFRQSHLDTLKSVLRQAWLGRGLLSRLLWPMSQVYGLVVSVRRYLYQRGIFKSESMRVPVVVVGNVVAGGAGKTPLVIALVKHLQACGLKPGVLSRGYGRSGLSCREVQSHMSAAECGDEPLLIQRTTAAPVFIARQRAEAARALLAAYPSTNVLICDDGLQHYALKRDIAVAVFDERGIGNGWLLPAGPLREPWPLQLASAQTSAGGNAPRRIDLVLHTGRAAAFAGFTSSRVLAARAIAADGTQVSLDSLRGRDLVALAGIASPEAFFSMLRERGLTLSKTVALPDHYSYAGYAPPFDAAHIALCTEKDAVKLFAAYPEAGQQLLAVPLEFSPEPSFLAAFDLLLAPLLSPLPSRHGYKTA